MNNPSKEAADKIMVEKLRLMSTNRFFASILLHFKIEEDNSSSTMNVNSLGLIRYNSDFILTLNATDLRFVLCHELMHVILNHLARFPEEALKDTNKANLWNCAVDLVVNDLLLNKEQMAFTKPKDDYFMPDIEGNFIFKKDNFKDKKVKINVRDKTAEVIYYELLKLFNSEKVESSLTLDEHIMGKSSESESNSDSNSNSRSNSNSDKNTPNNRPFTEEELKDIERKWSSIVASANMEDVSNQRNSASGWVERLLKNFLKPQLNWRSLLRRYIKETIPYDSSYKKPRKRTYSTGIYYPIIYCKPSIITAAIDISGSISQEDMQKFITEIYGIARAYSNLKIRILFWSTVVDDKTDKIYQVSNLKDVLNERPKSTYGTFIGCVEDYIESHDMKESSIIYLTDGFVESNPIFKCKNKKRIFIIEKNGHAETLEPYGQTAKLKD